MTLQQLSEWVRLGARLMIASPEKFSEIVDAIREVVGTEELIASYDWQLWLTGSRPKKHYQS